MARTTYMTITEMIKGPDTDLQAIVYGVLMKLSADLIAEDPAIAGHGLRRKWAERVRRDPAFAMRPALVLCAANTALRNKYIAGTTTIVDADVEPVLSGALWQLIGESMG